MTVLLDVSDKAQVAALWSKVPSDLSNVDILGTYSVLRPWRVLRADCVAESSQQCRFCAWPRRRR